MCLNPRPVKTAEWVAVGAIVILAAFLRLWKPDLVYFSLHTARDLYRSLLLLRGVEFPLLGSELQYGGRVLGPFMYILCAPALAVSCSPVAISVFIGLLNTALVGCVWALGRRYFSPATGLWAAALYAVFPLEIAQLRFCWNPCFLPAMSLGALACLLAWTVQRRAWAFAGMVVFIILGIQLHMSAIELFVSAGLVAFVARARVPRRIGVATVALVLLLFLPLIIHEITAPRSDVAEIIVAPDTARGSMERWSPNPNGLRNFFYHVRPQMHERGEALGFAYLQLVPLIGPHWLGDSVMRLLRAINLFGQLQLMFWAVGVVVCIREWRRYRRIAGEGGAESVREARARMLPYLALLAWQAVPVGFLCMFNYHGAPGEPPSLAPIRYYLVTYPAPFLTTALGIAMSIRWALGRRPVFARRSATMILCLVAGGLVLTLALFSIHYIRLQEKSGRAIPYAWPNLAPNLRSMFWVRDVLLGEAGLDRDAWYERVHAQQLGDYHFGEATFDWLITQDPRSVTNPPPDPRRRWFLHSPYENSPAPKLPPDARELRRWTLRDTGISVVEYEVDDPASPLPDNSAMRNFYYQDVRMRYLGPDKTLRTQQRERERERERERVEERP